jgi:hypothetical protein
MVTEEEAEVPQKENKDVDPPVPQVDASPGLVNAAEKLERVLAADKPKRIVKKAVAAKKHTASPNAHFSVAAEMIRRMQEEMKLRKR